MTKTTATSSSAGASRGMNGRMSNLLLMFTAAFALLNLNFEGSLFANGQTLEDKWSLTIDEAKSDFDDPNRRFNFVYYIDDTIVSDNTAGQVFEEDCMAGGKELTGSGITNVVTSVDTTGEATFSFDLDVGTLALNQNVTSMLPNGRGQMMLCSHFGLQTADGSYEVNFLENIITIGYSLTGDFDLTFTVGPANRTETSSEQIYKVTGYLCNPSNPDVELPDGTRFTPGSVISVCVKPDDEALLAGLGMKSIDSFTWIRGGIEQPAVEAGLQSSNSLTLLSCAPGAAVCSMESVLFAAFYQPTQEPSAMPSESPTNVPTVTPQPTVYVPLVATNYGGGGGGGYPSSYGGGGGGGYPGGSGYGYNSYTQESYTFPFADKGQANFKDLFVHGLCTLGSDYNSVYSKEYDQITPYYDLSYLTYDNFTVGSRLWGDRDYTVLNSTGETPYCEGGKYLQPNRHKDVGEGTYITASMTFLPWVNVTLCAFVEGVCVDASDGETCTAGIRDGDWPDRLEQDGFVKSNLTIPYLSTSNGDGVDAELHEYCKQINPPTVVSCGQQLADSCANCPQNNIGCNGWAGDCGWDDLQNACVPRENLVSCGGHFADSCTNCPQGNAATWCNGDCTWDYTISDCINTQDRRALNEKEVTKSSIEERTDESQRELEAAISGAGSATLQFPTRRRLLKDGRILEDADPVAEIPPVLVIADPLDDGPVALTLAGANSLSSNFVLLVLGVITIGFAIHLS